MLDINDKQDDKLGKILALKDKGFLDSDIQVT